MHILQYLSWHLDIKAAVKHEVARPLSTATAVPVRDFLDLIADRVEQER